MTRAPERPSYPWRDAGGQAADAAPRAAVRGRRAGVVTRCLANAVDAVVVVLLVAVGWTAVAVARFLLSPTGFRFPAPSLLLLTLVWLGVLAVYFAVTWAAVGFTYGDRLLGLRVVDDAGDRLHWGRACARAVLCTAVLAGILWVLVSRENRSLQDLVVRSSVVYD